MDELKTSSSNQDDNADQASVDAFASEIIGEPFVDDARKLNLNKLLHLAPYSEVLLLAGDKGVGKSVILQQFVARARQLWKVVHISSNALMTPIDVSRSIVHGFGLPSAGVDDVADLLSDIGRYLQALGRGGRRAIIVVDDVDLLQDEVVRLLETILEDERSSNALSIVFSTQSKEVDKFARFAILQSKLGYTLHFEPLSERGTKEYIKYRLEQANQSELRVKFPSEVINQIYAKSRGLPAVINDLARKTLGNEKQGKTSSGGARLSVWGPAVAGVVIVAGILSFQDEINQLIQDSSEPAVAVTQPVDQSSTVVAEGTEIADGSSSEQPVISEVVPSPVKAGKKMGELAKPSEPESLPDGVEVSMVEEVSLPEPQPIMEPINPPASDPKPLQLAKTADKQSTAPAKQDDQPAAEPIAPLVKKEEVKVAPTPEKPKSWIASQNPENFTMQLMALRDEAKVKAFVNRFSKDFDGQGQIFYIERKGKILTALAYGSFPTRTEAVAASKNLPKRWAVGQPWIRSLSSVQKDMIEK